MIALFATITVLFSPLGGCESKIVGDISGAKKSVLVQAYSLTSKPIIDTLIKDAKRGVQVRVILDKSYKIESPKAAIQLPGAGIETLIDAKHAIAHAKVIVIDAAIAYSGSYNWTWQAEHSNSEVLFRISANPIVMNKLIANFTAHASHSVPINVPAPSPPPAPTPSPLPSP